MGYKELEHGEQLNPDKLNSKFDQIYKLLGKAYVHNNKLKRRLAMINAAFETSANIIQTVDNAGEDEVVYDVPMGYRYYDHSTADGRELFIGGDELLNGGQITLTNNSGLKTDGLNLILDTEIDKEVLSRIPLTENEFGELEPSHGTALTSAQFSSQNLPLLLSPDILWAEKVSNSVLVTGYDGVGSIAQIEIDLPGTLTPFLNTVKFNPIPGVKYRLYYRVGGIFTEITPLSWTRGSKTFYIDKDAFTGGLRLDLASTSLSNDISFSGFGVTQLEALYDPFIDLGSLTGEYTLNSVTNGTVTSIDVGGANFDNMKLIIYNNAQEIVYDSSLHGIPYPVVDETFDLGGNVLKFDLELTKTKGTTPSLPYLKINYKETT